jgi:hypothetical protein
MTTPSKSLEMFEVTDPLALAQARARRERFERNLAWFQAHAEELYRSHRGQCVCVAGAEPFIADSAAEALARATAAYPEDDGRFTRYIPRERTARIYAHQPSVAAVR